MGILPEEWKKINPQEAMSNMIIELMQEWKPTPLFYYLDTRTGEVKVSTDSVRATVTFKSPGNE